MSRLRTQASYPVPRFTRVLCKASQIGTQVCTTRETCPLAPCLLSLVHGSQGLCPGLFGCKCPLSLIRFSWNVPELPPFCILPSSETAVASPMTSPRYLLMTLCGKKKTPIRDARTKKFVKQRCCPGPCAVPAHASHLQRARNKRPQPSENATRTVPRSQR